MLLWAVGLVGCGDEEPKDTSPTTCDALYADGDGDGTVNEDDVPDIVVSNIDGLTFALSGDTGSVLWQGPNIGFEPMTPAIGDLDGDGWAAPMGVAADIDMDGQLEVVVGNALYDMYGNAEWYNGQSDGFVAIGDFDADPLGEIPCRSRCAGCCPMAASSNSQPRP